VPVRSGAKGSQAARLDSADVLREVTIDRNGNASSAPADVTNR
jgi:hypothetical protein